ncbi:hypothetical protein NLG97_g9831 [Lecanicillium saksenae]|uniref:Uncharacterized protein n=1 Tax=Lecanicillium saksenae TaxID=468837 RepID=A0ACC1QF32_9HYPO|nr:hypothetical protein NLG97_g9831 [Lecanicillium saksenae]
MKVSIEIGPSTQFTIFDTHGENVDPSLSRVSGREALVSQPQQNPTTQYAVAQEILTAIGNIDNSSWSRTDETRKTQGWVFTYVCNHSWQQWTRHGKAAQTHAILDYSQKELDFTSGARPAYDCRGSVTIIFSKGNSAITVNYSHTPFHRTVGEIYNLFKPPPPPPRVVAKKKAPGSAKKSDTPRRKRPATGPDGAPTPKKPRSRPKNGAKNQLSHAELVPMTEGFPSANGATTITANDAADHVALAALSAATSSEPVPKSTAPEAPKNSTASLNVSPKEAARRGEVATKKLTDAGINPATLSADQFSIFSNQSPEVQNESLNMLVKYGAERLHIVHPAKKDSPRPTSTPPDAESIASGAVNPNRLGNDSASESAEPVGAAAASNGTSKTPQKAKAGTKSRVFCFNCKLSISKARHYVVRMEHKSNLPQCSKDKPSCAVCQESGLTCEYPARRPKQKKSAAIVDEDEDTIMSENVDADGEVDDSAREAAVPAQAEDHRQPPNYGQVPIANMMQITPDDEGNGSRPQGDASLRPSHGAPAPNPFHWNAGGLALPQGQVYYPAETNTTKAPLPTSVSAAPAATTPKRSQRVPKPTAKAKARVPTPVQARIISPPRERHESPLERHNPRRHEIQSRSPLTFGKSPPNPYGQPATQPQYGSDPYIQNPSYGSGQGAYPQIQDTAPERIAYDPNARHNSSSSRAFSRQQPPAAAHADASKSAWPSRGRDVAAADTLQSIHGYGGSSQHGNKVTPVPLPHLPGSARRTDAVTGARSASNRDASRESYPSQPSQQQTPAGPNQPQPTQNSWYGFGGAYGGTNQNTQSHQSWGGSGGNNWNWN